MPAAQYWQHVRSGEIYAVRMDRGRVIAANGPLDQSDCPADPTPVADNGTDPELADDINGAAADYRLWSPPPNLVSVAEVAERLGTTSGTVHSWRRRHADFPAPLTTLAVGPIWRWEDVARWAAVPRRPGRPRG